MSDSLAQRLVNTTATYIQETYSPDEDVPLAPLADNIAVFTRVLLESVVLPDDREFDLTRQQSAAVTGTIRSGILLAAMMIHEFAHPEDQEEDDDEQ